jgi:hypothetical protein
MLWQQKFFVNSPFSPLQKVEKGSSLGQVCTVQPDGTWSCPAEGEQQDSMLPGQSPAATVAPPAGGASAAPTSVQTPKPFPIVPVAVGGAAILAAVLLLGK